MSLPQTALLAAILLCAAASLWHSATAFRDRPLLIAAGAAASAAIIAVILPQLRILGLVVLCAGACVACLRWSTALIGRERARRASAAERDTAPLTAFFVAMPLACTALYALLRAFPLPGEPREPWLRNTMAILPFAVLLSAYYAARTAAWPAIAARFAVDGEDPSTSQRIMICATTAPMFPLSIGLMLLYDVGVFGGAFDRALLAGFRIVAWTAALTVVPGLPLAWWWAARCHRAERGGG
jgi:hypothetical protein